MPTPSYKHQLLQTWEETYKKGQLTLWLFLALREKPKYVNEIKQFIEQYSNHTISCEEQSLYRTLRKYHKLEMVAYSSGKGHKGPDRKYYHLTPLGNEILKTFIDRNIKLFFNENLSNIIFSEEVNHDSANEAS